MAPTDITLTGYGGYRWSLPSAYCSFRSQNSRRLSAETVAETVSRIRFLVVRRGLIG